MFKFMNFFWMNIMKIKNMQITKIEKLFWFDLQIAIL